MTDKQMQFNMAMERFQKLPGYVWTGRLTSFVVIASQIALGALAFRQPISLPAHLLAFIAAFALADFVNGLAHMYMDNNDDYNSIVGPLVAAFHLHHRRPQYKINPLHVVYIHESGSKIWLAALSLIAVPLAWGGGIRGPAIYILFYFSALSSIAEISHYLCHTPAPKFLQLLGKAGILMSARYHSRHHTGDNFNYTFLNCMTDPLVNMLARVLYPRGYKKTTDTHYAFYEGSDTENR
jgi:hypothetical protein